jgi:hypothetical protein
MHNTKLVNKIKKDLGVIRKLKTMLRKNCFRLMNAIGIIFCTLYVVIMVIEINNFSPYNTGIPFFADRLLEFLLPGILCFILARICRRKFK